MVQFFKIYQLPVAAEKAVKTIEPAPGVEPIVLESGEPFLPCWAVIATFIATVTDTTATTAAVTVANMVATANRASIRPSRCTN
jgi:hypothetical protein